MVNKCLLCLDKNNCKTCPDALIAHKNIIRLAVSLINELIDDAYNTDYTTLAKRIRDEWHFERDDFYTLGIDWLLDLLNEEEEEEKGA